MQDGISIGANNQNKSLTGSDNVGPKNLSRLHVQESSTIKEVNR